MSKLSTDRRAFSPVIAAVIVAAATVAVSTAVVVWVGALSFGSMQIEGLLVVGKAWADDATSIDLTVKNVGSQAITITDVLVNERSALFTYTSGDATLEAGETATLRVSYEFVPGTRYEFSLLTTSGQRFPFVATAPYT